MTTELTNCEYWGKGMCANGCVVKALVENIKKDVPDSEDKERRIKKMIKDAEEKGCVESKLEES